MRKLLAKAFLLAFAAVLLAASPVYAVDVVVEGQQVVFEGQGPAVVSGRIFVPVRGVFEMLGFAVEWEEDTQTAVISNDAHTIRIPIGSSGVTVNGVEYELDVPAAIIGGSAMAPATMCLQALGLYVFWDTPAGTVFVSSQPTVQPEPEPTRDLIVALQSLAISMDPIQSNDTASAINNNMLFSSLVTMDPDTFEVYPALAINWSQPTADTVHMELRRGVTFHNGTPLTSADVKFSLERAGRAWEVEPIIGMIDTVEIIDDYNFIIHLDFPFAPILRHLAHVTASILSVEYFDRVGPQTFAENPIGTGPFVFDHVVISQRVEMRRNDNYWGQVPQIDTLTFRAMPDQHGRLIAVQTGAAHIAEGIAPAGFIDAQGSPDVTLMRRMNLSTNYIGFNTRAPHLDNPLVRQAINYMVDVNAIVEHVLMGFGAPVSGPIANITWGYYGVAPFNVNIDRAKELMAQAGLEDGFSTTIWYNVPNPQRQMIAEMVQYWLAEINIDVVIIGVEWGHYLDATAAGEHDMFILAWVSVTGDADYGLFPLFHSAMFGAAGNRTFWSTPETDRLLDEGRETTDPARRLEIYREIQLIIRDEAPWVFLNQGETLMAASPDIGGFAISPWGHHNFATVYFR